jgi:F-type H+-transporting ATPase subunit b
VEQEAGGHEVSAGFPPFDQLDTFTSQIFWLAVTFAVLYFALAFFLLPKLQKGLAARDGAIADNVATAAALSRKADDAVKALEARIAEAKSRARDTAAKARAEADTKIAAETAKVEADLAAKLGKAEANIAAVRTSAMSNVGSVAEDAVAAIVEKLADVKPVPASVRKAVADAIGRG